MIIRIIQGNSVVGGYVGQAEQNYILYCAYSRWVKMPHGWLTIDESKAESTRYEIQTHEEETHA